MLVKEQPFVHAVLAVKSSCRSAISELRNIFFAVWQPGGLVFYWPHFEKHWPTSLASMWNTAILNKNKLVNDDLYDYVIKLAFWKPGDAKIKLLLNRGCMLVSS
jgi:hypothetical protein